MKVQMDTHGEENWQVSWHNNLQSSMKKRTALCPCSSQNVPVLFWVCFRSVYLLAC